MKPFLKKEFLSEITEPSDITGTEGIISLMC